MKEVLKNQKMLSAVMAFSLAAMITVFAASSSFGETSNEDISDEENRAQVEVLERAIADVQRVPFEAPEASVEIIKVFSSENELVGQVLRKENEIIADKEILTLINRAEFLSKYGSTSIYRISE